MTYLDSSAIVKLYAGETHSGDVADYVRGLTHPLIYSPLHDLEVRNSLRLKVFRKEEPSTTVVAVLRLLDDDIARGILMRPGLHWPDVFRTAIGLSDEHSMRLGGRSLDLLHVASAILLGSTSFLTFDERQRGVAREAGVETIDMPATSN